jgi:hypothetical protein
MNTNMKHYMNVNYINSNLQVDIKSFLRKIDNFCKDTD